MSIFNRVFTSLRFAGLIKRYHTWPTLREQTVAEHTWHVLRIYYTLFGPPPLELWIYMLFHDAPGEMGAGDVSFHAKRKHPALKAALDAAEQEHLKRMGMEIPAITEEQHARFKICDVLEMLEFGEEESNKGNRYAEAIIDNTMGALDTMMSVLSYEEVTKVRKFIGSTT